MNRYLLAAALITVVASPAIADEVGVRAGPVGAGVSVGESHDRDRDRDRTVVKEREPSEGKTVIKKEDENGNREKTVIHRDKLIEVKNPVKYVGVFFIVVAYSSQLAAILGAKPDQGTYV